MLAGLDQVCVSDGLQALISAGEYDQHFIREGISDEDIPATFTGHLVFSKVNGQKTTEELLAAPAKPLSFAHPFQLLELGISLLHGEVPVSMFTTPILTIWRSPKSKSFCFLLLRIDLNGERVIRLGRTDRTAKWPAGVQLALV